MHLLAQADGWVQPNIDYHALAPEIVLAGAIVVILLVDLFLDERQKWATSSLAGIGLLAAFIPILTLAVDGETRVMFGGAYVVDDFSLVLKASVLAERLRGRADLDELRRRGRLLRRRVLHAAALLGAGHAHDLVVAGSGVALHRPRAAVDPGLHACRVAQARREEQRGGHEVLPPRSLCVGGDALRHVAALRRHRIDAALDDRRRARRFPHRAADRHARDRVRDRRVRVQGVGGAVPQLGTRHLRGRADARDRVPVGGVEGSGIRRAAHARVRRVPRTERRLGAGVLGARRAVDDRRQPGRAAPDEHGPHARLLVDRAGRVHPDAVGGDR